MILHVCITISCHLHSTDDVGMMVDSTEESFKAPQAAFAAREKKSEKCDSEIM